MPITIDSNTYSPQSAGGGYIYNADCPKPTGILGPYQIQWGLAFGNSGSTQVEIDPTTAIQTAGTWGGIQTVYVDNSRCPFDVEVLDTTGQTFDCPAGCQGFFPVGYLHGGKFFVTLEMDANAERFSVAPEFGVPTAGNFQTNITLLNYKKEAQVWKARVTANPLKSINVGNVSAQLGQKHNDLWNARFTGNGGISFGELFPTFLIQPLLGNSVNYYITKVSGIVAFSDLTGSNYHIPIFLSTGFLSNGQTPTPALALSIQAGGASNLSANGLFTAPLAPSECGLYVGAVAEPNGSIVATSLYATVGDAIVPSNANQEYDIYINTEGYLQ